jgi:hypothetical protein
MAGDPDLSAMVWRSRDWRSAMRMALLIGDTDAVDALCTLEECAAVVAEDYAWCKRHGVYHSEDGCGQCAGHWPEYLRWCDRHGWFDVDEGCTRCRWERFTGEHD